MKKIKLFERFLLLVMLVGVLIYLVESCTEDFIMLISGLKPATITVKKDTAFIDDGVLGMAFHKKLKRTVRKNPQIKTLVLLNVPGSINDEWNLKTCAFVYKNKFNTKVLSNSVIESGAVDLFASGRKLFIEKGAKIGVHSWDGGELPAVSYPKDHEEHKFFLELYKKIKIDTAFYWFTLRAAPAEGMHYMNPREIEKYFGSKLGNKL